MVVKDTVLAIEDDSDIVELLQYNLQREGFPVITAGDGESGLSEAIRRRPGIILLDLMLPGMDGLEVCRQLKQRDETRGIPVIIVSAKGEENDVILGLEMGADDYIPKPFSPREVVARVRAVLRRATDSSDRPVKTRIELGDVALDLERFQVEVDGEVVPFTRSEFRLLWSLAASPGRVFTRDQLVDRITEGEVVILDRNIDVHVSAIRKKLGASSNLLGTVRGVGYKLED